jgi:hypothetical protein
MTNENNEKMKTKYFNQSSISEKIIITIQSQIFLSLYFIFNQLNY